MIVATIRALKYHGGVDVKELGKENLAALEKGITNLERHVNNVRNNYGLPCVVAINHRTEDTDAEVKLLQDKMAHHGAKVILARHWAEGGKGAADVAHEVVRLCDEPSRLQVRLRGRGHALGQDEGDRHQDLRRLRHHRRLQGAQRRSRSCRRRATATTRSASPRRSTRSRPIRSCAARRPATS